MSVQTILSTLRSLLGKPPQGRADFMAYLARAYYLGVIRGAEYKTLADADWNSRCRQSYANQKAALLA